MSQQCHITRTFFNRVHLLPKKIRFELGGAKLASWPGRHLTIRYASAARFWLISSCLWCSSTDWPTISYSVRRTRSPSYGIRDVTRGEKGSTITRSPNNCGGRQMNVGGAGKSQQCHMYILQYSKFASERSWVQTWERQTCFLPRVSFNFVTPL